jgi:hypothetical protein
VNLIGFLCLDLIVSAVAGHATLKQLRKEAFIESAGTPLAKLLLPMCMAFKNVKNQRLRQSTMHIHCQIYLKSRQFSNF